MDGYKSCQCRIVQSAPADLYCGPGGSCGQRSFLTREEKVDMLKQYKDSLQKEVQAVSERIDELKKEK